MKPQSSPAARVAAPAPTAAASLLALTLAATGCATAGLAPPPPEGPLPVRLPGLEFLSLGAAREPTLEVLAAHGYTCLAEAASAKHAACTRPGQPAVVVSFAAEQLDAVRTSAPATTRDPRDQFDDLFAEGRRLYPQAFVQRTEDVAVARFLPGDGSSMELRYFAGGDAIQQVHFAPVRRPPPAPRVTRR